MAENGRAAYLAWIAHYDGEGELSKRTALAKAKLETLHYKSERSLSFEWCTEMMMKCFHTLHKDPDQRYYSEQRKVEKLLTAIPELTAAKVLTESLHGNNFANACGYFSQQVSRVHGPAQLEYRQEGKSCKRGIYAIDSQAGVADGDEAAMEDTMAAEVDKVEDADKAMIPAAGDDVININGVNITDPHRSFTRNKWDTLGPEGCTSVLSMRERTQERGGRTSGGCDGGGRG
jgi:hypothetical protein